jgi:predicted DNA-binding WGR domain protein
VTVRVANVRPPLYICLVTDIELAHDDPAKNCRRRYRLRVEHTLFGEALLVIEWGRAGQRRRQRVERFPCAADLAARFWEILRVRQQHGYVPLLPSPPSPSR